MAKLRASLVCMGLQLLKSALVKCSAVAQQAALQILKCLRQALICVLAFCRTERLAAGEGREPELRGRSGVKTRSLVWASAACYVDLGCTATKVP